MMRPSISVARRACESSRARQVVVVFFGDDDEFAVVSYGETKQLCSEARKTCNAIADAFEKGILPRP